MNIKDVYPSRFLTADDLKKSPTPPVNIREVKLEKMRTQEGEQEKPVVYFEGSPKGLVLNKTNAMAIASLYGNDTDNWKGKPVVLQKEKIYAFGEQMVVIRVVVQGE